MKLVALFTVKLHHRLVAAATESLEVQQMSKQRSCLCQHSSSSVATAVTGEPAAHRAWLVLTPGCDCSCYAETSSLFHAFKVTLCFHRGLDLLQSLSSAVFCCVSKVWHNGWELCSCPTWLTAGSFEWLFFKAMTGAYKTYMLPQIKGPHRRVKEKGGFTSCSAESLLFNEIKLLNDWPMYESIINNSKTAVLPSDLK